MQIVIDIDEDDYKLIKDGGNIPSNLRDLITASLFYRIRNGKLLPKGHGRLGDLSKIYVELNEAQIEGTEGYKGLGEAKQIVCDAPTIVEADTESEE